MKENNKKKTLTTRINPHIYQIKLLSTRQISTSRPRYRQTQLIAPWSSQDLQYVN